MTGPSRAAREVCWALANECRNDDVLVVGVATPLATAAALLAREILVPELTVIIGGAVDPAPFDMASALLDPSVIARRATTVLGQIDLLTLLQGGRITLQFVSPAQVDADGAINTSRVRRNGGWRRLPGCLALPDTAALVGRLVAYRIDGGDRFLVDAVDHVTGLGADPVLRRRWALPGRGVVAIVTEHGRRDVDDAPGVWHPLAEVPAAANELLDGVLDPHGVLDLETRTGRAAARAALGALESWS